MESNTTNIPSKKYHVTGTNVNGRRFLMVYTNLNAALCINLFKGSIWEVYFEGEKQRRKLIKRVTWSE